MDIFFCDECAARVTDADLHRGHGIKKGDVIVCASCIEKGLGLDRLSKVGAEIPAAAAQPALAGAGALDEVRDRAQTSLADPSSDEFDDFPEVINHNEPDLEEPQVVAQDSPLVIPAVEDPFAEVGEDPIPKAHEETRAIRRTNTDDLADVATGFAVLSSEDRKSSDIDELPEDQVSHVGSDINDEADLTEEPEADLPEDIEDDLPEEIEDDLPEEIEDELSEEIEADLPEDIDDDLLDEGYEDEEEGLAQGAIDTLALDQVDDDEVADDDQDEAGALAGQKRKRRRGSSRRSSAKSSSRTGRADKDSKSARTSSAKSQSSSKRSSSRGQAQSSKSSRRGGAAPKKKNTMGIMLGVISALCFGIIGLVIIASMSGGDQPTQGRSNPFNVMLDDIQITYDDVVVGLRQQDVSKLKQARAEIGRIDTQVIKFETNLPQNYDAAAYERALKNANYYKLKGMMKAINDAIIANENKSL